MKSRLILTALLATLAIPFAACSSTIYTGDRVDGIAVIEKLDVSDLPAGQATKLWFRVSDQSIGQGWYVPVVVIKGAKPGAKLLLTAGIHGDELTGIAVIQQMIADIDPKSLNGVIVAVPGLNTPGLLHSTREFSPEGAGSGAGNLNRLMPGDVKDSDSANIYAGRLWSQIFIGNADIAIDMHTQSRGTSYPMYVFAETAKARHMADLIHPDIINMDPGVRGAVETTLNANDVAAVTLELGTSETFDPMMIKRAIRGVDNVMKDAKMMTGELDMTGPETFIGNEAFNVTTPRGGFAHIQVALGDDVKAGDILATVTNPFGDVIATIKAPKNGRVLSVATDPRRDPGNMLVRLITWTDQGTCAQTGCPPPKMKF